MGIAIEKLFAQLLFWLYDFLDAIFETFQVLAGLTPVTVDGAEMSLIDIFLTHSTVTKVFLSIFLISIFVVMICTIAKVITTMVNIKGGERKSHAKTVGQGFGAIITSLVMAVVLITFITVSNSLLVAVQNSFNPDYRNLKFSQMLFELSVEKSYQYDYENPLYKPIFIIGADGKPIQQKDEITGELKYDDDGNPLYELQRDENGNVIYEEYFEKLKDKNGNEIILTGWVKGNTIDNIDFTKDTPDTIFGVHKKVLGLFESENKGYTTNPKVELQSFNFWTAYLVVCVMLVAIIWSMLGLVKRIFDLVFLLLALPLVSATIPLDDGAKFKTWRDTVISKIVLAFGVIFSINIFILLMQIIDDIDFSTLGWSGMAENIFKMFLMMGGALAINGGQILAARLVGGDASESREMTQSARALTGGVMAAGGLARGVKNAAIGGQNKYGHQIRGVLPMSAKTVGGMTNMAGNLLGGAAYRGVMNTAKGKVGNVANALRGLTKTVNLGGNNAGANIPNTTANNTTGEMPKRGVFHNGILGAFHQVGQRHKATGLFNGQALGGNSSGVAPNVINNNQMSTPQGFSKPDRNTGVDDMVSKMSVLQNKDGNSGAFKPPKK